MTASTDRQTTARTVTLRYWASARAAAGTDSDALEVAGPVSLAELVEPCARGARGLAALRRRALLLLGDGGRPARHDGRSGLGSWSARLHRGVPAAVRRRLSRDQPAREMFRASVVEAT